MRSLLLALLLLHSAAALEVDTLEETPSWSDTLASGWISFKSWLRPEDGSKWHCGSKRIVLSEDLADLMTKSTCPSLYKTVNLACVEHDGCYDRANETRSSCDEAFCLQLRSMIADEEDDCQVQKTFCFAVKKFGRFVYTQKSAEVLGEDSLPI